MNGKKISAALSALPEDMVAEAMEPGHRGRSFSWLRLAVCAVLVLGLFFGFWPTQPEIVTAPGLLTVTVYAMDENSETGFTTVELEEGVTWLNEVSWNLGWNYFPGLPISLSLETDDFPPDKVTFEIRVSSGKYMEWGECTDYRLVPLPDEFTQENNSIIYWTQIYEEFTTGPEFERIYTDIVIKCEDNIIGYSVLRFDRHEDKALADTYDPFYVASVMFPKVNGQYQNITQEYVERQLMVKEK